jgi:hypothetical protein
MEKKSHPTHFTREKEQRRKIPPESDKVSEIFQA